MKPFDVATDVTLECPFCRSYKTVARSPELPAEVRLIEIICPDCDDGDFHSERWFSAPGVEVSQDRQERDEQAIKTATTEKPTAHLRPGKSAAPLSGVPKPDPRDPDHSRPAPFDLHNCWRCKDGTLPCVGGNPRNCENLNARND